MDTSTSKRMPSDSISVPVEMKGGPTAMTISERCDCAERRMEESGLLANSNPGNSRPAQKMGSEDNINA